MIEALESRSLLTVTFAIDFTAVPKLTAADRAEIVSRVYEKVSIFDAVVVGVPMTPVPGLVANCTLKIDSRGVGGPGGYTPDIGSWGGSEVYANNLDYNRKYIAELIAHEEVGHDAGGLQHHLAPGGGYAPGLIMGDSTMTDRGLWANADGQDDLAILRGRFGQHEDVFGRLETVTDEDTLGFDWPGGIFAANVKPVLGGMVDLAGRLEDAKGNTLFAQDPANRLGIGARGPLAAGFYTIVVRSHGAYADVGQYLVNLGGGTPVPTFAAVGIIETDWTPLELAA